MYHNFQHIMYFGEDRMNPFLLFFHHFYSFRGSAKFKTDLKSEYRNNIFQFEIHYFSLNKNFCISMTNTRSFMDFSIYFLNAFCAFDIKMYRFYCQITQNAVSKYILKSIKNQILVIEMQNFFC